MAAEPLPEALWEEIEPLLPPPSRAATGRPPVDNKKALRGILFVLRFGVPWQRVPTDAFGVSGSSCWRRFREWTDAGEWPEVQRRVLNRLGTLGVIDLQHVVVDSQSVRAVNGEHTGPNPTDRGKQGCKRHVLTDAEGNPLVVQVTPANVPDQAQLPALLDARPAVHGPGGRGRPRRTPEAIIGDRAYGTQEMIAHVESRRIESMPVPRADPTHGSGLGRLRYVVERTLACFSHFRRLRLCYERWGAHVQAFHVLAAALLVCSRLRSLVLLF
jgi:transposase